MDLGFIYREVYTKKRFFKRGGDLAERMYILMDRQWLLEGMADVS
jgi:hypothetical protein